MGLKRGIRSPLLYAHGSPNKLMLNIGCRITKKNMDRTAYTSFDCIKQLIQTNTCASVNQVPSINTQKKLPDNNL